MKNNTAAKTAAISTGKGNTAVITGSKATGSKGRLIMPKTAAAAAGKAAAAKTALNIETGKAAMTVAALGIDSKKTAVINGKAVNFLGHVIEPAAALGGKNCAIDTALINLANEAAAGGHVDFTAYIATLCGSTVRGGKVFTPAAMAAKFTAHCRHFAEKGKVPCLARLTEIYGPEKGKAIRAAMLALITALKTDTLDMLAAAAKGSKATAA